MEDNKEIINSVNWNNMVMLDARSKDRASLGQVQGLFEPCVVVEKGTLNKETYYIPKSVIEKYEYKKMNKDFPRWVSLLLLTLIHFALSSAGR